VLSRIVDPATAERAVPLVHAGRVKAEAAWEAVRAAGAVGAAARVVATDTAIAAAWAAAGEDWATAGAAWEAARVAAWEAVLGSDWVRFESTVDQLQRSAISLFQSMITPVV
jgi:hypothetical protein